MKNRYLLVMLVGIFSFGIFVSASAVASTELNIRQSIGNSSMNKISSARIKGMFATAPENAGKNQVKSTKEFGRRGCSTSVGNQQPGGSLLGQPRDVTITGDVINVCL